MVLYLVSALISQQAEVPLIARDFIFNFDNMDEIKCILVIRNIVTLDDSLVFLCENGVTTMFKQMVCDISMCSFPASYNVLRVISSFLKADNIDILTFLLEFDVSLDSCLSSVQWD